MAKVTKSQLFVLWDVQYDRINRYVLRCYLKFAVMLVLVLASNVLVLVLVLVSLVLVLVLVLVTKVLVNITERLQV